MDVSKLSVRELDIIKTALQLHVQNLRRSGAKQRIPLAAQAIVKEASDTEALLVKFG